MSEEPAPAPASNEADLDEVTGTWFSPDGAVATRSAQSFEVHGLWGAAHCEWQSVLFLSVLWPVGRELDPGESRTASDTRQYVRDADGKLDADRLAGELDLAVEMPVDAENTGYHTESVELWLGPDGGERYAYLAFDSHTERWPRAPQHIACA